MSKQHWIYTIIVVLLVGITGLALTQFKPQQTLAEPGLRYSPIPDDIRVNIHLPELVLDMTSEEIEQDTNVVAMLPKDTSLFTRRYQATDGFWTTLNVVLMGTDRTSIHKPEFCLEGQGWKIDSAASTRESIPMERPRAYDLPVIKLVATHPSEVNAGGQTFRPRALYVYWFVADNALSADPSGFERMWSMAREMFYGRPMQRWAYVSYLAVCAPGQEEATFERMKKMIAASVPEFQTTPRPADTAVTAQQRPER
jgi:hypothetical protein